MDDTTENKGEKNIMEAFFTPPAPREVSQDERTWAWECSDEVKKVLETMGLFHEMEEQMRINKFARTKREVDLAKGKLDTIGKAMMIIKSSTSVYKDTGVEEEEKGFDKVEISITRSDGD